MREYLLELLETTGDLQLESIALRIIVSIVIAAFIFLSYRLSHSGSIYSRKFNVSLVALTVITATVMIVIGNNIALSLGMVGALSIVRFRTAIKEPMDIVFLFWAIAVGIVLGAGLLPLAVFGSLFIGVILLIFANRRSGYTPYLLVVSCGQEAEQGVMEIVRQSVKKYLLKSKTVSAEETELTVEVRLAGDSSALVNEAAALPGVRSAVLVSYNGEYQA